MKESDKKKPSVDKSRRRFLLSTASAAMAASLRIPLLPSATKPVAELGVTGLTEIPDNLFEKYYAVSDWLQNFAWFRNENHFVTEINAELASANTLGQPLSSSTLNEVVGQITEDINGFDEFGDKLEGMKDALHKLQSSRPSKELIKDCFVRARTGGDAGFICDDYRELLPFSDEGASIDHLYDLSQLSKKQSEALLEPFVRAYEESSQTRMRLGLANPQVRAELKSAFEKSGYSQEEFDEWLKEKGASPSVETTFPSIPAFGTSYRVNESPVPHDYYTSQSANHVPNPNNHSNTASAAVQPNTFMPDKLAEVPATGIAGSTVSIEERLKSTKLQHMIRS